MDTPVFICTRDPSWTGRTARIDPATLLSIVPPDGKYSCACASAWYIIPCCSRPSPSIPPKAAAERTLVYVCGPASMIDDTERVLSQQEGGADGRPPILRKEQVLFEKWW